MCTCAARAYFRSALLHLLAYACVSAASCARTPTACTRPPAPVQTTSALLQAYRHVAKNGTQNNREIPCRARYGRTPRSRGIDPSNRRMRGSRNRHRGWCQGAHGIRCTSEFAGEAYVDTQGMAAHRCHEAWHACSFRLAGSAVLDQHASMSWLALHLSPGHASALAKMNRVSRAAARTPDISRIALERTRDASCTLAAHTTHRISL